MKWHKSKHVVSQSSRLSWHMQKGMRQFLSRFAPLISKFFYDVCLLSLIPEHLSVICQNAFSSLVCFNTYIFNICNKFSNAFSLRFLSSIVYSTLREIFCNRSFLVFNGLYFPRFFPKNACKISMLLHTSYMMIFIYLISRRLTFCEIVLSLRILYITRNDVTDKQSVKIVTLINTITGFKPIKVKFSLPKTEIIILI
jgi:hypothetical protein